MNADVITETKAVVSEPKVEDDMSNPVSNALLCFIYFLFPLIALIRNASILPN